MAASDPVSDRCKEVKHLTKAATVCKHRNRER